MTSKAVAGLAAGAAALFAQSVTFFSEFQRPGPDGTVIAADRQERPREILSPAVARNAYSSFHLVVAAEPGTPFTLHFGHNPENTIRSRLYREIHDAAGLPDRLEKVALPLTSSIPEGRRAEVFWVDLWVDGSLPSQRVRVEAQVWIQERWIIYPLEVRVYPNVVFGTAAAGGPLPPASAPADAFALPALRGTLCGKSEAAAGPAEPTVRTLIQRNARQDAALAAAYNRALDREMVVRRLASEAAIPDVAAWCSEEKPKRPAGSPGPEWYLKIRDRLVRGW
ncbi:MAG: hypothetical protein HY822_06065 [Acidobacteria bacterium]|nr:hypothetical protein [Acidobacteriota bacterium]